MIYLLAALLVSIGWGAAGWLQASFSNRDAIELRRLRDQLRHPSHITWSEES